MPAGEITIGQLAERTGVPVTAIRFYERKGLMPSRRTRGNQRRYPRSEIRRLTFIRIAQSLGLPLARIAAHLAALPEGRAPNARDWDRMARGMRADLDRRIAGLEALRDRLTGCIGCGCLSLESCALWNPGDADAAKGPGAHRL
ncbi:MerR family redox-sensitive transcriptional activator SoxR [Hasllibacter halocynthiae]|uniref:MerR family redox-sensitive transcriptional activator SoxR n=1 Tax=Hasllibacter halocynthiae TaxID=595589 RepID=A0A2T0X1E9_9RHOB|nr:redox-sensitive transcriptional activator SoxR [Hasllibacter halocynthiae]PRY92776.1 MerR family redox-sensitive transcriptional activator SoxR [Hasllibacter halocynthiae]